VKRLRESSGVGKTETFLTLLVISPLPPTRLDWALVGDPCEGIDVTLEVTP
jgi:hypothetical protein